MMLKTQCSPQTRDPFQNLFQRVFGDSLTDFYGGSDKPEHNTPRTNISENDTSYELSFELPGVEEEDLQVEWKDQVLTVTAERKDSRKDDDNKRWHRIEHRHGHYSRSIALPQDAGQEGIEAVFKSGVLHVTVPKQPEAQPAKIAVRSV